MKNNLELSEIDIDGNSAFCPKSNNGSPNCPVPANDKFLFDKSMISAFATEEPKALTKSSVLHGLDILNETTEKNHKEWRFERTPVRPSNTRDLFRTNELKLPMGKKQESDKLTSAIKRDSNDFNDLNHSKITSLEFGNSPAFITENKVMSNPKMSEPSNFHLIDSIEECDTMQYQQTTFYLKKFNIFSNTSNMPTVTDDSFNESAHNVPVSKKLTKSKKSNTGRPKKILNKRFKRKITCNCKNSGCVKLYCECFSNNGYCKSSCKCKDCKNNLGYVDTNRLHADKSTRKTPNFYFKIEKPISTKETLQQNKACHCKKSKCRKKYCECYNSGLGCNENCTCTDCLNNIRISNN